MLSGGVHVIPSLQPAAVLRPERPLLEFGQVGRLIRDVGDLLLVATPKDNINVGKGFLDHIDKE